MKKIIALFRGILKDLHFSVVPNGVSFFVMEYLQYDSSRDLNKIFAYILSAVYLFVTCADMATGILTEKASWSRTRVGAKCGLVLIPLFAIVYFAGVFGQ